MEDSYLAGAVGQPLAMCLAELICKLPFDPIEWMSHWLYRYIDMELYFLEKSIHLQDAYRMQLELEKEQAVRQRTVDDLTSKIKDIKKTVSVQMVTLQQMLDDKAEEQAMLDEGYTMGRDGKWHKATSGGFINPKSLLGETLNKNPAKLKDMNFLRAHPSLLKQLGITDMQQLMDMSEEERENYLNSLVGSLSQNFKEQKDFEKLNPDWKEAAKAEKNLKSASETSLKWGRKLSAIDAQYDGTVVGDATWSLDQQKRLICDHSLLGQLKSRRPYVPPETPDWWEKQGYLDKTLYDHEVYSTNDTEYPNRYDHLVSLSYKDFVDYPDQPGEAWEFQTDE